MEMKALDFLLTGKWKGQMNPHGNGGPVPRISYMKENLNTFCVCTHLNKHKLFK